MTTFDTAMARWRDRNKRSNSRTSAPDINSTNIADIGGLLDRQVSETADIQRKAEEDRASALSSLQGTTGFNQQEQDLYSRVTKPAGMSPFEQMIQDSLSKTLANPDVFSQGQIESFGNIAQDSAATSVRDAITQNTSANARRGVQGGTDQNQSNQLMLDALADIIRTKGDLSYRAAEARSGNLANAQGLSSAFAGGIRDTDTQRLGIGSDIVGRTGQRDFDRQRALAEIFANTDRTAPDYSGFASLGLAQQQGQANLAQSDSQHNDLMQLLNRDSRASTQRSRGYRYEGSAVGGYQRVPA